MTDIIAQGLRVEIEILIQYCAQPIPTTTKSISLAEESNALRSSESGIQFVSICLKIRHR